VDRPVSAPELPPEPTAEIQGSQIRGHVQQT
jgi:hypothetical protein